MAQECKLVTWCINYFEHFQDNQHLLKSNTQLTRANKQLEAKFKKLKTEYCNELVKNMKDQKELRQQLKKQQDSVIKPLLANFSSQSKMLEQFQRSDREKTRMIKGLRALLQSPRMCDIYYKQEYKRLSEQNLAKLNAEAVQSLLNDNLIDFTDVESSISKLASEINEMLSNYQDKGRPEKS